MIPFLESYLFNFAIGIATNAAVEAIVRKKIQIDELNEGKARALLEQNEMFEPFEHLLEPHLKEVLESFEVAKELQDFLLSDAASGELANEMRRQAAHGQWSTDAAIAALTIPDGFGLIPELEQFVSGVIDAIQRTIARDQVRWNESLTRAVARISEELGELRNDFRTLQGGQQGLDFKADAALEALQRLESRSPGVPEWYSEDLAAERNEKLDEIRTLARRGLENAAILKLQELQSGRSWEHLPTKVKQRTLRMHAGLALGHRNDHELAERLLAEADNLDPYSPSRFHRALFHLNSGQLEAALQAVDHPATIDEWHIRGLTLIHMEKPSDAVELLCNAAFESNAETYRIIAIAKLMLRRPLEAKSFIDKALSAAPDWFTVQEAAAKIYYYSSIATRTPDWGLWEAPAPTREEFIKTDPDSQKALEKAGGIFQVLMNKDGITPVQIQQLREWRLGCLCNLSEQTEAAEQLCLRLVDEDPLSLVAVSWAIQRRFSFDRDHVRTSLQQAIEASPSIPRIQTLFAVLCDMELFEDAAKLLDDYKQLYVDNSVSDSWDYHRVQLAVVNNEEGVLAELLAGDNQIELRGEIARVKGKKEGWTDEILEDLDLAFRTSDHSSDLYTACEAHQVAGKFDYVLDHAERLLESIPTERTLMLVLDAAYFSRKYQLCLELTDKYQMIQSGGRFSTPLRRLRSRCLYRMGRYSDARDELRRIQTNEISTEDRLHLFDTQLKSGDPSGALSTAKELLDAPDLPVGAFLHIADRVRPDDLYLAREAFRRAEELGFNNPATAAYAIHVGFKIGVDDRLAEALTLATQNAGEPGAPMTLLTSGEILEKMGEYRAAEEENQKEYREGRIPVHLFASHGDAPLSSLILSQPELIRATHLSFSRTWSLRIRNGSVRKSRISASEPPSEGIFLDITSLLLQYEVNLLELVEEQFSPLLISSATLAWLDQEISEITGHQISREEPKREVSNVAGSGKLELVEQENLEPFADLAVSQQMGPAWSALANLAIQRRGLIVDFLPLRKAGIDAPLATLPESIKSISCDLASLCYALKATGKLSAQQTTAALEKLGQPEHSRFSSGNCEAESASNQEASQESETLTFELSEGQTIVLQSGQIEELSYAGVLNELVAFAKVIVRNDEIARINAELSYYDRRKKLEKQLKELRHRIARKIQDKTYVEVSTGELDAQNDEVDGQALSECLRCTLDSTRGSQIWTCIDDRMVGGFKRVGESLIVDTVDLLGFLERRGVLSQARHLEILHHLRSGNLRYLNVTAKELIAHLEKAQIKDGAVIETAELATLRKYFAACLADEASLQRLPANHPKFRTHTEALFLMRLADAVLKAIKGIWSNPSVPEDKQIAYSDWLLESLWFDAVGLPSLITGFQETPELVGLGLHQLFSIGFQLPGSHERRGKPERFWRWLFTQFGHEPRRWNPVLKNSQAELIEMASQQSQDIERLAFAVMHDRMLQSLPRILHKALKLSSDQAKVLGEESFETIELGPLRFRTNLLWSCAIEAFRGNEVIIDTSDQEPKQYRLRAAEVDAGEQRTLIFEAVDGGENFRWSDGLLCLLLDDPEERRQGLESLRSKLDLSVEASKESFDTILDHAELDDRVKAYASLEDSAFTRHLSQITDHLGKGGHIDLNVFRPRGVKVLLQHLRLRSGLKWEELPDALSESARVLLREEGFMQTFLRHSSLPFALAEPIQEAFLVLELDERRQLSLSAGRAKNCPLLAMHTASLLLQGSAEEKEIGLELLCRLADQESCARLDYFGTLLRWAFSRLYHDEDQDFPPIDYILSSWVFAGRLNHQLGPPSDLDAATTYFRENRPSASIFAFSSGALRDTTRIHPTQFDARALQLGGLSRLLADDLDPTVEEEVVAALKPACFPIPELPAHPSAELFQLGGFDPTEPESYTKTNCLLRLSELSGLEDLAKALEPTRSQELKQLLELLLESPNDADRWTLVSVILSGNKPNDELIELLTQLVSGLDFREYASSPEQLLTIGFFVFELAQFQEFRDGPIDWTLLLRAFGSIVLEPDFAADEELVVEICFKAASCVGVSAEANQAENAEGFVNALRSLLGDCGTGFRAIRIALFRIACRQSDSIAGPLWRLISELRELD